MKKHRNVIHFAAIALTLGLVACGQNAVEDITGPTDIILEKPASSFVDYKMCLKEVRAYSSNTSSAQIIKKNQWIDTEIANVSLLIGDLEKMILVMDSTCGNANSIEMSNAFGEFRDSAAFEIVMKINRSVKNKAIVSYKMLQEERSSKARGICLQKLSDKSSVSESQLKACISEEAAKLALGKNIVKVDMRILLQEMARVQYDRNIVPFMKKASLSYSLNL